MQAVKDSFYMALRQRLAQLFPQRTMGDDNQPALVVSENATEPRAVANDVFYLRWVSGETLPADAAAAGWHALRCEIAYATAGTKIANGEDRGRALAELDAELRAILVPRQAALLDYTQDPAAELNSTLLWTQPVFNEAKDSDGVIQRTADLTVLWQEAQ